ncbi:MAG: hypothetical protein MZV70_20565 [Desulfobacterales bacterium]|nr:hypothetical protein [Desulfobacterales bacterium]
MGPVIHEAALVAHCRTAPEVPGRAGRVRKGARAGAGPGRARECGHRAPHRPRPPSGRGRAWPPSRPATWPACLLRRPGLEPAGRHAVSGDRPPQPERPSILNATESGGPGVRGKAGTTAARKASLSPPDVRGPTVKFADRIAAPREPKPRSPCPPKRRPSPPRATRSTPFTSGDMNIPTPAKRHGRRGAAP